MIIIAEYIWIDGGVPTATLRSKTKVLHNVVVETNTDGDISLDAFPDWGADGSSTNQAIGRDSDIGLRPIRAVLDPFRDGQYLVLCEVLDAKGFPHSSNHRAKLRAQLDKGGAALNALFGFEQEYTFFRPNGTPLGFPEAGYPAAQGPYYCSVGSGNIYGRAPYEDILAACLQAGLVISGSNYEVMPGQAEIQVGAADGLKASDHVWLTRWIMHRISEDYELVISLDAKPVSGDWNGAGMHTNFSTKDTMGPGGLKHIEAICAAFSEFRQAHLDVYGNNYELRLTGEHETCSHREFRWGVADRTASIRVPRPVAEAGCGYLEDRRPNANADPYLICERMIKTVMTIG